MFFDSVTPSECPKMAEKQRKLGIQQAQNTLNNYRQRLHCLHHALSRSQNMRRPKGSSSNPVGELAARGVEQLPAIPTRFLAGSSNKDELAARNRVGMA